MVTIPNEAFSCVEIGKISAALGVARIVLGAKQEAEQQGPCSRCGYGGKYLDAPPCTACPAHPKEAENNAPLTLDELRKMDGDPVWITPGNFWALVRVVDKLVILVASDGERAYAGAWIEHLGPIYRRKPEER